jgi:tRNA(fMet)-specific endonuclease VapC
MMYMLDTNICIYIINKKPEAYIAKLESLDKGNQLSISSIVLAELQYGVSNSQKKKQNQINLDAFLTKLNIVPYCEQAAFYYGEIRSTLQKQGNMIGHYDLLIASHAIAEDATLVTNNASDFIRVKDLVIDEWKNDNQ